ncbi:hypothetical protein SPOG_04586 [Schizosaccharomyces cryophilus OY26]|uniref:Uncharacterized protein n=1 Tax=Schizosaccharomyces cryophilus (strain OY26 / ATCC MYA-4695 / CBS 11777 / NBRC 106824 / NRRL Y48691) TaxID=653667 RepID=S9XIR4_SCHCR|nr:uncharacterized protein SPOG_04586 [Schizosaccharomyces cryophilus OY26]EPY53526.1 hypothetical protein SPOG_04586 [Schizosaccharomyces cryophilus OY26]
MFILEEKPEKVYNRSKDVPCPGSFRNIVRYTRTQENKIPFSEHTTELADAHAKNVFQSIHLKHEWREGLQWVADSAIR